MNQTLLLSLAIPFALASYVPLFATALSTSLVQKLRDKETRTRSLLIDGAIQQLRAVQVQLEDFFARWDPETDPFFISARPRDLKKPVADYLRFIALQDRMRSAFNVVSRLTRIVFWFLVSFAALTTIAVILGALSDVIGTSWGTWALVLAGGVFVSGAIIYLAILIFARRVDKAHGVAMELDADRTVDDGS